MNYRLLLTNRANGKETEITVSSRLLLEDLSVQIKLAMKLPLTDKCWHRFLSHGTAYMPSETCCAEQEIRSECNLYVGRYREYDHVRLSHLFTVLGSAITYIQDRNEYSYYHIRCTLLERI